MIIETKFKNGDVVFYASVVDGCKSIPCEECGGSGHLKIEGKSYKIACRECRGRGERSAYEPQTIARQLTVGMVRVAITDSPGQPGHSSYSNYGPQHGREEEYMCIETGVRSGSVYPVEDLFATEAEALDRARLKLFDWRQRRAEEEERERKERENYAREFSEETDEPA